ncbi:hypothetical protein G3O06_41600 [Burkholderia sp. Ac-20345]|uniref:hypothetical protein n=1 Tax=Burkholderia sp. Ac-20345 TaxID=2703891 RepID=UPI00197C8E15|nr:hypothetical protein [Burkholderia sp. Ac-20345]MBN3783960.1 hypothetical protein [Burkholderia sp. Ac-20345]
MLVLVWEAGGNGSGAGQITVNGTVNRKSRPAGQPAGECDRARERKRMRVRLAGPAKPCIGRLPLPGTMGGDTRRWHFD